MKITSIKNKRVTLESLINYSSASSEVANIILSDDSEYPIEAVSYATHGVRVLTREGPKEVLGAYVTKAETVKLTTEVGSITCTKTHKMWVPGRGWTPAEFIDEDDTLLDEHGVEWPVLSVEEQGIQKVMDICVKDVHEYYGNGFVSHNSLLANQLGINQARLGYKITNVPLEMSLAEQNSRVLANVSKMNSIDIFLKRLTAAEKDKVYIRYRKFNRQVRQKNGQLKVLKPKRDATAEEILNELDEEPFDVGYIDYLNLLKDADGEDQWKKLGQIARLCKVYAERRKRVIGLLVQVDDDGRIRYSQAVKEHSSLAWIFVATKESRDKGFININLLKARNQVMKPFTLGVDYESMRVFDLSEEDQEKHGKRPTTGTEKQQREGGKKGGKSEYMPDLAE